MNKLITAAMATTLLAAPAMAADAPGYFKVPGTDTTMKIYGQVELRNQYGLNGNQDVLDQTPKVWTGTIPGVPPTPVIYPYVADQSWNRKGTWKTSYRGRFGFTTTTPSSFGDINVKVEGQANSKDTNTEPSFTLRHAYGTIGGFLLGQTDSLFGYGHYEPNSLWGIYSDENGSWSKARQVRYTFAPAEGLKIAFSIEQEQSENASAGGNNTNPTIVGAINYSADWGGVAFTVGHVRVSNWALDAGTGPKPDPETSTESKSGLNLALSGCWNITPNDVLTAMVVNAGGNWGAGGSGLLADGFMSDTHGNLKFYKSTTWNLAYGHTWNDQFSSNVGIGQVIYKKDKDILFKFQKNTMTEFFVNTYWQAAKNVTFGAEYQYAQTKMDKYDDYMSKDGDWGKKCKDSQFRVLAKFTFF